MSVFEIYIHMEKNSLVKFIELFKSWGYTSIYRTEFWKIYSTFQNKMRNIQEKSLKVLYFILKRSLNFLELGSVNAFTPNF